MTTKLSYDSQKGVITSISCTTQNSVCLECYFNLKMWLETQNCDSKLETWWYVKE